jgi:protein-S-isoprenylcysteine O-methyltransferase Ste14
MRGIWIAAALVAMLAGAVFLAQGLDLPFAPTSTMTADRTWAVIGAVLVGVGLILGAWAIRRPG